MKELAFEPKPPGLDEDDMITSIAAQHITSRHPEERLDENCRSNSLHALPREFIFDRYHPGIKMC